MDDYDTYGHGFVIETKSWNGKPQFWRNGHGWMRTLRQATIFVKKNDAISKCVHLGSRECTVLTANFSTGMAVYPPSRVSAVVPNAKQATGRWIPVSERLPEPDYMGNPVGVLACLPDGERCIAFCDNDEYGVRWQCNSTQKPTHWMPLPEPPETTK